VKRNRLQDYLKAHDVWPELRAEMSRAGLRNYSMFYRADGLIVGYLEGDDIQKSLRQISATEVSARWEAGMAEFFEGGNVDGQPAVWNGYGSSFVSRDGWTQGVI